MADEPVKEDRITRIPLVIVTVAGGHRTEGVLVGVTVEQLDALEADRQQLANRIGRPGHGWLLAILDIADCLADGDYDGERGADALRFLVHEADPAYCVNGHTPGNCGCDETVLVEFAHGVQEQDA